MQPIQDLFSLCEELLFGNCLRRWRRRPLSEKESSGKVWYRSCGGSEEGEISIGRRRSNSDGGGEDVMEQLKQGMINIGLQVDMAP